MLSILNMQAQSITGQVFDSEDNPLAWATVSLFSSPDSILITGTLTDTLGQFMLEVDSKHENFLEVEFLGFETYVIQNPTSVDLSKIRLNPEANQLGEVIVRAKKPNIQFANGILSYSLNEGHSAADNGIDVLASVPMLRLDKDDNVLLRGKKVKILVDGKDFFLAGQELNSYLKSLNGDQLSKIEVITNPSAKWEAEGNTGIVNIITKEKPQGHLTNMSLYLGYGQFGKIGGSVNTSFQSKKLGVAINLSPYYGNSINVKNIDRTNTLTNTHFIQTDTWLPKTFQINANISANYAFNENNTTSIFYKPNYSQASEETLSTTDVSGSINKQTGLTKIDEVLENRNTFGLSHDINLDTLGTSLSFEYLLINAGEDNMNIQNNFIANQEEERQFEVGMDNQFNYLINSFKSDYNQMIKKLNFSAGLKFSTVENKSQQEYLLDDANKQYIPFDLFDDEYDYNEKIYAAYTSLSGSKGNFSYQAGLRVEHTNVLGTSTMFGENAKKYTDLFPNLSLSYKIKSEANLSFSYSKRINRPYYRNLNPAVNFIDIYTFVQGDPLIDPSYSNNVELGYQKGNLVISAFHNNYTSSIDEILIQNNETSVVTLKPVNMKSGKDAGISINKGFSLGSKTDVNVNGYYGYNESILQQEEKELVFSSNYHGAELSVSTNLHEHLKFRVNGSYSSAAQWGIFKSRAQFYSSFSMVWNKEDWTVSLKVHDPFNTSQWNSTLEYGNIKGSWVNRWENRKAYLTLKYRFGNNNLKNKGRYSKSTNNEEGYRI